MNRHADRIVFYVCLLALIGLMIEAGYQYGKAEAAKQCATVPGQQVVSTTADTCTYASAYGRSTIKTAALTKGK